MTNTAIEITWIRGVLKETGVEDLKLAIRHCDNTTTLAAKPVFLKRTKHIKVDCHFIRDKIQDETLETRFISSKQQLADVMTKALGVSQHEKLVF